jgi:hypothetical protein
MRASGYIGASLMYETLFDEIPESRDWVQLDENGHKVYYTNEQTFRYMACRNNPGFIEFNRRLIRLGVGDMKMDMIHFDQMHHSREPNACRCRHCTALFREYLRTHYPGERAFPRFGFTGFDSVAPPPFGVIEGPVRIPELHNPLMQEWARFRSWSLARRYAEYNQAIKEINPQAALIGNPSMHPETNRGFQRGIDLQQLLEHGDTIWSEEGNTAEWTADERLVSQIRTYKEVRTMGQTLVRWQVSQHFSQPIAPRLAEAVAFNDMNLGAITQASISSSETAALGEYMRFMRANATDLRGTESVADAAVLRSFPSIEFNPARSLVSTILFEQTLIQGKIPFGIVFDKHLSDLKRYKVLVLANQDALGDEQVDAIRRFVQEGGGLVATEDTSLYTSWRTVRDRLALADLFGVERAPAATAPNTPVMREVGKGRVVYIPRIVPQTEIPPAQMSYSFSNRYWKLPKNHGDLLRAVRWAARDELSASAEAPPWTTIELARQPSNHSYLLHVVNYRDGHVIENVPAEFRVPPGYRVARIEMKQPGPAATTALNAEGSTGLVRFRIPKMKAYALIVLRLERT